MICAWTRTLAATASCSAIDQTEVTDVLELGKEVLSRAGCVKISTHLVQRMAPGRAALFVRNHGGRKIFYDARFVDDRSDNVAADIRVVCGDGRETVRPPELVSVHYAVGKKGLKSAVDAAQDRTEIVVFLSSSNWSEDDYLTMHDAKPEDTVASLRADRGRRRSAIGDVRRRRRVGHQAGPRNPPPHRLRHRHPQHG